MRSGLAAFYEALTRRDPVRPADLIVVMAGRMERKNYGLHLYRQGIAPRLLLSVGRFEVSRMQNLAFPELNLTEFKSMRDRLPPAERHFFVEIGPTGVQIDKAELRPWNTFGESRAIRERLLVHPPRRVIIVSTDVHLRRIALTFRKMFAADGTDFAFCPVPAELTFLKQESWWTRAGQRRFVLNEAAKLAGYRLILSLPLRVADALMALKSRFA